MYHFIATNLSQPLALCERVQIPGHIGQYLKDFQLEAIRFLHAHFEKQEYCILNDEEGLGKCAAVAVYLGVISKNKRSLIVVQNDDKSVNDWRFHFDVLTNLTTTFVENGRDVAGVQSDVFIIKWITLRLLINDLTKLIHFDYIIIDNRKDILNNNFCSSLLIKNFENRVNLLISNTDVTSDLRLMHNSLRLGNRLERQYENYKSFEEKFRLPDAKDVSNKKIDLEEYFLKREILRDFCKDFRLRRYRHQYASQLPLVDAMRYELNLDLWRMSGSSKDSNDPQNESEGVNGRSHTFTDTETEELFQNDLASHSTLEENILQNRDLLNTETEESAINGRAINHSVIEENSHPSRNMLEEEPISMSPLLLDSESESNEDDKIEENPESENHNEIDAATVNTQQYDVYEFIELTSEVVETHEGVSNFKRQTENISVTVNNSRLQSEDKTQSAINHSPENKNESPKTKAQDLKEKNENHLKKIEKMKKPLENKRKEKIKKKVEVLEDDEGPKTRLQSSKTEKTQERKMAKSKSKQPSKTDPKPSRREKVVLVEPPKRVLRRNDHIDKGKTKVARNLNTKRNKIQSPVEKVPKAKNKSTIKSKSKNPPEKSSKIATPSNTEKQTSKSPSIGRKRKRLENVIIAPGLAYTRSMQRSTRSSDALRSKYMTAPLTLDCLVAARKRRKSITTPSTSKDRCVKRAEKENVKDQLNRKDENKKLAKEYRKDNLQQKVLNSSSNTTRPSQNSIISSTPEGEEIQCGQKLLIDSNSDNSNRNEFVIPHAPRSTHISQFSSALTTPGYCNDSDVVMVLPAIDTAAQEIIELSSSQDEGSSVSSKYAQSRRTRVLKHKMPSRRPPIAGVLSKMGLSSDLNKNQHHSPDLFSASTDLSLPCTQHAASKSSSTFEGFKIFGSEVKQMVQNSRNPFSVSSSSVAPSKVKHTRSCLDILEKIFEPRADNHGTLQAPPAQPNEPGVDRDGEQRKQQKAKERGRIHEDEIFEITNNETFGSLMRINANGEVSPVQATKTRKRNKITNYLIGTTPTDEDATTVAGAAAPAAFSGRSSGGASSSLSGTVIRKSPKSKSTQITKLTKWFQKNQNTNRSPNGQSAGKESPKKELLKGKTMEERKQSLRGTVTKRRRLDLSFDKI